MQVSASFLSLNDSFSFINLKYSISEREIGIGTSDQPYYKIYVINEFYSFIRRILLYYKNEAMFFFLFFYSFKSSVSMILLFTSNIISNDVLFMNI